MECTVREVLQYVEENDVKFVKLTFCDIFGRQKNLSIVSSELEDAFKNGVSFDASAVSGFMNIHESNLLLFPDPSTMVLLPWRPQSGRVIVLFCNIKTGSGNFYDGDTKSILESALARLRAKKLSARIGTESEFYIFKLDENGEPTNEPFDKAGYCDSAPLDKCENLRRDIICNLEDMGFVPQSSHHEKGHGQNEIVFKFASPVISAHNMLMFKSAVKNVAERNGVFASFLPKPLEDNPGSGMHINISVKSLGENIFENLQEETNSVGAMFLEGVLSRAAESTLFCNPTVNSYDRIGSFEAPTFVSWSKQNQGQLIRVPQTKGKSARLEVRSPDSTCNPYLAFALIINAGLDGIESGLKLRKAFNNQASAATNKDNKQCKIEPLPKTMAEAIVKAEKSEWLKTVLPTKLIESYCSEKKHEIGSDSKSLDGDF